MFCVFRVKTRSITNVGLFVNISRNSKETCWLIYFSWLLILLYLYILHCPFSVPFGMVNLSNFKLFASSKDALEKRSHAGFRHRKFGIAVAKTSTPNDHFSISLSF